MAELRHRRNDGAEYVQYTAEETERSKDTDIIYFLEGRYGWHFKRVGRSYHGVEHDSLTIDADRKRWYWNSRNLHGRNVYDWLQKVEGMNFYDSMQEIIGVPTAASGSHDISKRPVAPIAVEEKDPEVRELNLPPICRGKFKQMFGYLTQKRKLDYEIIQDLVNRNYIYQGYKEYKSQETGETFTYYSTVFVGYDENNDVKFAEAKPTAQYTTNKETGEQEKTYARNVYGSDKRYSFNVPADKSKFPQTSDILYVFEAPVDLLSHCTLYLMDEKRKAAAEGRKHDPDAWKNVNRLSLSGCSDVALKSYLERNPHIKRIVFALDNDPSGRKAAIKLEQFCSEKGYQCKKIIPPQGKDFNEFLCAVTNRREKDRVKPNSPSVGQSRSDSSSGRRR